MSAAAVICWPGEQRASWQGSVAPPEQARPNAGGAAWRADHRCRGRGCRWMAVTGRSFAGLLHHMRELVGDQAAAVEGAGSKLVGAEHDVVSRRVGEGVEVSRRLSRGGAGMQPHLREVAIEAQLHEGAGVSIERPPAAAGAALDRRRHVVRRSVRPGEPLDDAIHLAQRIRSGLVAARPRGGRFRASMPSAGIATRATAAAGARRVVRRGRHAHDLTGDAFGLLFVDIAGGADRELGLHAFGVPAETEGRSGADRTSSASRRPGVSGR